MTEPATPSRFIGCDVGKQEIVAFDSLSATCRPIANTPQALATFVRTLDANCLVVCEATGGHEAGLLAALAKAGIPAHRADARKVKAFIRSFGTLGKTDAIDAQALARYGAERHLQLCRWQAPDRCRQQLQTLVLTRRDLVDGRTAWNNRLKSPNASDVAMILKAVIASLERQIAAIERNIQTLLNTAVTLIALMPELGTLTRRQAASLAGLAPHPRQSGNTNAYRPTRGGRPAVKRTLFMATLVAAHHNPEIKSFYQRLQKNGKKPIVALTAVMRKLITIANAKIRDDNIQRQVS